VGTPDATRAVSIKANLHVFYHVPSKNYGFSMAVFKISPFFPCPMAPWMMRQGMLRDVGESGLDLVKMTKRGGMCLGEPDWGNPGKSMRHNSIKIWKLWRLLVGGT